MNKFAKTLRRAVLGTGLMLLAGWGVLPAQVNVTLPNLGVLPGATVTIPVTVSSLTGQNITAFQFDALCDTTILRLTGVSSDGTLSAGLGPVFNNFANGRNAGRMTVTCASATPLTGSGILIYLTATAQNISGNTSLQLSSFLFNTGTPAAVITNGSLRINRAPTIGAVSAKTVAEKATLSFTVTAADPDLPNDALTYSLSGAPTGATIAGSTGVFTWVPEYGQAGPYSFRVKVTDLGSAVDSTTVSVTVTHTNRSPSFVNKLSDQTINQGAAFNFTYTASDPDAGTTLTYSLVNPPSGATINSSGVFTFVIPASPAATYSIVAVVSDGSLTDSAKATLTVNKKPVLNSRTPSSLSVVSQNVSQPFSVNVSDPEGSALTYTWKLNGVVDPSGTTNTFAKSFSDVHNTAKVVTCVFTDAGGAKDSTTWNFTITGIDGQQGVLPTAFALGQNYPNPFNPTTTIRFDLPKEASVTLEIYNVLGLRIRTLLKGESTVAGYHTMAWDGRDDQGVVAPSGVYLYRIAAGDFVSSRKMTLLK